MGFCDIRSIYEVNGIVQTADGMDQKHGLGDFQISYFAFPDLCQRYHLKFRFTFTFGEPLQRLLWFQRTPR